MSKIEIINRALLKLGEPPVSSLNDVAFGRSYDMVYEDMKKLLLSSYPWRFAVGAKNLAKCEEMYGKKTMYRLPSDCLLLLKVFEARAPQICGTHFAVLTGYEVVNDCVVTEIKDGVCVEYVREIEDDRLFPALFREALSAKIAAELSMRLKHSINFKQAFDNEFYNFIRQAELNNEISKDVEVLGDNSWVLVKRR